MEGGSTHDTKRTFAQCMSLDHDSWYLLRAMCPNGKGIGRLVSDLIRREAQERIERPTLQEQLAALSREN